MKSTRIQENTGSSSHLFHSLTQTLFKNMKNYRLTTYVLGFSLLLLLFAPCAANAAADNGIFAELQMQARQQRVTINVRDTPLDDILLMINRQTSLSVGYQEGVIDKNLKFSLNVANATVESALNTLFAGTPYDYRITNNRIMIVLRQQQAAGGAIRGKVLTEDGSPLIGATVMIAGSTRGVNTDVSGVFELENIGAAPVTLRISYVGMETQEIKASAGANLNITLKVKSSEIGDVYVTGYQTLSPERATGSFETINYNSIESRHVSDLSTALLGMVAGLQGTENEDGTVDYLLRGISALKDPDDEYSDISSIRPLIVVDGFPVANGFADINPNDVESVTVLKDAAAASIWGARSASGVIVITTRRAKASETGRLNVEVSASARWGEKIDLSNAMLTASSKDQVDFEVLVYENGWKGKPTDALSQLNTPISYAMEALLAHADGNMNDARLKAELDRLRNTNNRGQIKKHLLQNPVVQQYNVRTGYAGDRINSSMSVMYEKSQGSMKGNEDNRWRVNFNNTFKLTGWLSLDAGVNIHYHMLESGGATLSEISALSPYEMLLDDDGSYAAHSVKNSIQLAKYDLSALPYEDWSYNLLQETRSRKYTTDQLNSRFTAGLSARILDGLAFDTKFQYEYNTSEKTNLWYEESYYVRNTVNYNLDYDRTKQAINARFVPDGAIKQTTNANTKNYTWRNQLNFNRTFNGKHSVSALAGFEISDLVMNSTANPHVFGYDPVSNTSTVLPYGGSSFNKNGQKVQLKNILGNNASSIYMGNALTGTARITPYYDYRNDRYVSVYGNASYTYDNRYTLSASARSDASNLITDNAAQRWDPFWSVGGLWNMHRESFLADVDWINRLSVRLTYGYNGNVDKTTSPVTLVSMSSSVNSATGLHYASVSAFGNPYLRWERTATTNFGVDYSLFRNRLYGTIEIYNKQGQDIIGRVSIPTHYGRNSMTMNAAELYNRGVELTIGTKFDITPDVNFETRVTYAYNKNKITKYNYSSVWLNQVLNGSFIEGYPIQSMWSIKYVGMKEGVPTIETPTGNQYTLNDNAFTQLYGNDTTLFYEGPSDDPHMLGWHGTFNLWGVKLSFLINGKFGGHFRAPTYGYTLSSSGKEVQTRFVKDALAGSDKIPSLPDAGATYPYTLGAHVRYFNTLVESSSFIRLKEVTADYVFPRRITDRLGLGSLKVFAQVRDLGCLWVKNGYGYDPEWLPGTLRPTTSVLLGFTLNFK